MKDQKPNYPYTLARFVPGKKRSYIVFYIWNKDKGKKERVRDYTIDQYRDHPDFEFYKSKFIEDINELLINGAYRTNHETPRKFKNTREAVDFFMQKRGKITRFRTIQGYKQCLYTHFLPYLEKNGLSDLPLDQVPPQAINAFNDYLLTCPTLKSPHSIYNLMKNLSVFLNSMVESDVIPSNPYKQAKIDLHETRHHAFTAPQMKEYKKLVSEAGDMEFMRFIEIAFYTMARPHEIRFSRVGWVNLADRVFYIPPEISKNRNSRAIDITPPFYELLKSLDLGQYPPDSFLFGNKGQIGGDLPRGMNFWNNRFRKYRKEANLDNRYTLYSVKHYSVIKHFLAGYDLRWIMDQTGHKDLQTLLKYLRSLGLKINRSQDIPAPEL